MPQVFLGLGSNYHREDNIKRAIASLQRWFAPLQISDKVNSKPVDGEGDDYLNLCVGFNCALPIDELRETLKRLEQELGRDRSDQSRVAIDIDLLLYGDLVVNDKVPHPDVIQYLHVLKPLVELAPDFIHPLTGRSLRQHLGEIA